MVSRTRCTANALPLPSPSPRHGRRQVGVKERLTFVPLPGMSSRGKVKERCEAERAQVGADCGVVCPSRGSRRGKESGRGRTRRGGDWGSKRKRQTGMDLVRTTLGEPREEGGLRLLDGFFCRSGKRGSAREKTGSWRPEVRTEAPLPEPVPCRKA